MTNLNSISSSLSSLDTINQKTSVKGDFNKLATTRSHSTTSTSLLWPLTKGDRYKTAMKSRVLALKNRDGKPCQFHKAALNTILAPLLLLTIARQLFDFLGQTWLQILINFFTIILLIVALFGLHQHKKSYLAIFSIWSFLNTCWNIIVICIHLKLHDFKFLNEESLSLNTGSINWWYTNGPGCLPINMGSYQTTLVQPNIITGCRIDYHLIEAGQAAVHSILSFVALIVSCCIIISTDSYKQRQYESEYIDASRIYRLNNLNLDRSRINHNPSPRHNSTSLSVTESIKRASIRSASRASQHSSSSKRSARRSRKSSVEEENPRESSLNHRIEHKYGSLTSRKSGRSHHKPAYGSQKYNGKSRLPSISSIEQAPSYNPSQSSYANVLSTYGEISSIDSFNSQRQSLKKKSSNLKSHESYLGSTNPGYSGSRSSVSSRVGISNNYDNLSYVYGTHRTNNGVIDGDSDTCKVINSRAITNGSQRVYAETYRQRQDVVGNAPNNQTSNGNFHSFANRSGSNHSQQEDEMNNNRGNNHNHNYIHSSNGSNQVEYSKAYDSGNYHPYHQSISQSGYSNDRSFNKTVRQSIYLNQNQNSETPI